MNLSVYVGPYLETALDLDKAYESSRYLRDGRMATVREPGEPTILVPAVPIGVMVEHYEQEQKRFSVSGAAMQMSVPKRTSDWDKNSDDFSVVPISDRDAMLERLIFIEFNRSFIRCLEESKISFEVKWGVVPCWS